MDLSLDQGCVPRISSGGLLQKTWLHSSSSGGSGSDVANWAASSTSFLIATSISWQNRQKSVLIHPYVWRWKCGVLSKPHQTDTQTEVTFLKRHSAEELLQHCPLEITFIYSIFNYFVTSLVTNVFAGGVFTCLNDNVSSFTGADRKIFGIHLPKMLQHNHHIHFYFIFCIFKSKFINYSMQLLTLTDIRPIWILSNQISLQVALSVTESIVEDYCVFMVTELKYGDRAQHFCCCQFLFSYIAI